MTSGVYKRTKEHKKKIGLIHLGKKLSNKTKKKIGLAHLGKKHTKKAKRKMSLNHIDVSGSNNPNWKGGKKIHNKGYILILKHKHPNCDNNGYVYKHRLMMEKYLGRYLTRKEVVHHKGIKFAIGTIKNKQDNRIENLKLFENQAEHLKYHKIIKGGKIK